MRAQPPELHPAEAMRRAIREVFAAVTPAEWEAEQRRQRLVYEVPELQARAMQQYVTMIGLVAAVIAERAGLPADDFSARVSAGALIGAALASLPPGMAGGADVSDFEPDRAGAQAAAGAACPSLVELGEALGQVAGLLVGLPAAASRRRRWPGWAGTGSR